MTLRLFHISEKPDIRIFESRPSPSHYAQISGDVVFAVSERLLHNYLLPRDCPRVTFYRGPDTTLADAIAFMGGHAEYVIAIERSWLEAVRNTRLYCYEFPAEGFILLDECAGYYISYAPVIPVSVTAIDNALALFVARGVDVRVTDGLRPLADAVMGSSLRYSLIRMSNAKKSNF